MRIYCTISINRGTSSLNEHILLLERERDKKEICRAGKERERDREIKLCREK